MRASPTRRRRERAALTGRPCLRLPIARHAARIRASSALRKQAMDGTNLRVFEAVARLGSMSRAAQELNTVQSNVTARIRALEHELGVPLFHRTNRGVALTEAGQRLLPYAAQIGRLLADARRAVEDNGTARGPLTIGSLESTAGIRLPRLLATYAAANPEVDLVLTPGNTSE